MNAVGIILAGGKNTRLGKLTSPRVAAAIPIASNYRAIDFALSNMANSNVNKVAVITQNNSRSLSDHLSSSKWWNFGRKQGGLFVFTPYLNEDNTLGFKGTADSIYQNISFLEKSNKDYVIITNGECIYKMDYSDILNYHIEKDADITVMCREQEEDLSLFGVMKLDDDNRVIDFDEKPLDPQHNTISLSVYVIKRTLLIDLIKELHNQGRTDFVTDLLVRYRKRLKVYGYKYDRYWEPLNSVNNYFKVNMDFLTKYLHGYFYLNSEFLLTKAKDEPPVKYNYSAQVKNCSVGNGSIISGIVSNSVLGRNVRIEQDSKIDQTIILEHTVIGKNCDLQYVIVDKNAVIEDGVTLKGTLENPIIVSKGSTITA